jgi:hypothetical protein
MWIGPTCKVICQDLQSPMQPQVSTWSLDQFIQPCENALPPVYFYFQALKLSFYPTPTKNFCEGIGLPPTASTRPLMCYIVDDVTRPNMASTEFSLVILCHIVLAKFSRNPSRICRVRIIVWPKKLAPCILSHEVGPGCHDRKCSFRAGPCGGHYRHLTGPAGVGHRGHIIGGRWAKCTTYSPPHRIPLNKKIAEVGLTQEPCPLIQNHVAWLSTVYSVTPVRPYVGFYFLLIISGTAPRWRLWQPSWIGFHLITLLASTRRRLVSITSIVAHPRWWLRQPSWIWSPSIVSRPHGQIGLKVCLWVGLK